MFTRQSLRNHALSASHKDAVALEAQRLLSATAGGISEAFGAVETAEMKAMISLMRCMYWLCKNEIPHTTNFLSLVSLAKNLGATYLHDVVLGKKCSLYFRKVHARSCMLLG